MKGLKQQGQSNLSVGINPCVLPALPDRMMLSAGKHEPASEDAAIIQLLFILLSLFWDSTAVSEFILLAKLGFLNDITLPLVHYSAPIQPL